MTTEIIVGIGVAILLFVSWKLFFSPKGDSKKLCEKKKEEAIAAGKRYEAWRRLVIELINERNQLKREILDLTAQKEHCDEEYQKMKDAFNAGGVEEATNNDDAWWAERRRLKKELRAKKKKCEELEKELEKKQDRLREVEGGLREGRVMEELSRETYPEAWERYRECLRRSREEAEENTISSNEEPCCPSGLWIGIVGREGGELAVAGLESGLVYLLCLDNPDVTATLKWRGVRLGPALGGGAGIELIFLSGPKFPCKTESAVANVLGGVGFDFSAGPALADYLEGLAKSGGKLAGHLSGSSGARGKFNKMKDLLKGSDSSLKDGIKQRMSAASVSAVGSGFTGVTIPLAGVGLNIGLWYTIAETCELVSWSGCKACD